MVFIHRTTDGSNQNNNKNYINKLTMHKNHKNVFSLQLNHKLLATDVTVVTSSLKCLIFFAREVTA